MLSDWFNVQILGRLEFSAQLLQIEIFNKATLINRVLWINNDD